MSMIIFAALLATPVRAGEGVPPARLERLSRGVNLSNWLWLPQGKTADDRRAYFTAADAAVLKRAGLTHLRLPFDPERVWDRAAANIRQDDWRELEAAIDLCVRADLAVIVDAHPLGPPWTVPDSAGRFTDLENLWTALAPRLAATDPDRVFLEVLNEPHDLKDPALWPAAQERLAAIIRREAPHHTLIATGDEWGGIDGLLRLKPLADDDVVYSFHFYEPHTFTHQGATWGWSPWRFIQNLPYPADAAAAEPIAAAIQNPQAADAVRAYAKERWGKDRIATRIEKAAAWGRDHHAPIYCGEFGAFKEFSPRDSRLAWIRDAAAALNDAHIGWAMWDYAGGFALVEGKPGSRTVDPGVAAALGLSENPR
jgi:aryl-phospho-beta-D-glucosidase BglC (GH1 family)